MIPKAIRPPSSVGSVMVMETMHKLWSASKGLPINTPLQRGDRRERGSKNRLNGFERRRETVETVQLTSDAPPTPLKRGVNENPRSADYEVCEISGSRASQAVIRSL